MVGEIGFPASENHFFLHFLTLLSVFFRQIEKYFSTKSFIPAAGNKFSGYLKQFLFFPLTGNRQEN